MQRNANIIRTQLNDFSQCENICISRPELKKQILPVLPPKPLLCQSNPYKPNDIPSLLEV